MPGCALLGNSTSQGGESDCISGGAPLHAAMKRTAQDLRRDRAQELRNLQTDTTAIDERISSLEDNKTYHDKNVELLRQEIIHLHEQQDDLRVQLPFLLNARSYIGAKWPTARSALVTDHS
ncbi:hypothetical protein NDU88_004536 [Pleurodeles waltl]|uniref:Uncharacterized protein n=1 Tax=Pleurodeles waltl TaxID=8319 RepID=A0AAV7WWV8_PLEWA|nr:hypothetical protein NDU88_004536 [Pleurodeles waltl]